MPDSSLRFPVPDPIIKWKETDVLLASWRKLLDVELSILFGVPETETEETTGAEHIPLTATDAVDILRRLQKEKPRIFYQLNEYIPERGNLGQIVFFQMKDPLVWLLHPRNLPTFTEAVQACGCVAEPVNRDWWVDYNREQILNRPLVFFPYIPERDKT